MPPSIVPKNSPLETLLDKELDRIEKALVASGYMCFHAHSSPQYVEKNNEFRRERHWISIDMDSVTIRMCAPLILSLLDMDPEEMPRALVNTDVQLIRNILTARLEGHI